ncbi:hypothetical protein FHT39_000111 [Mitsuaria sp. BK045]|uniref:hypothetical protein n=1 Tax=unclassified Roseateles TaxID=2626991 RepID=UPI00161BE5AA|nr:MULTISPECIES: hypothetical protein [unclassified Roseateles]MBB3291472.1 hypothetical protein [Mitsuaria sp. BK041]MBB3360689.1 hypothetical protein [Mitsuaria sp. BK045]
MQTSVTPPRKTELARQMLAPGQRQLAPALRALLITVDGKRDAQELQRLARGLGLGDDGLSRLVDQGLVELPRALKPAVAAAASASTSTASAIQAVDADEVAEAAALAREAQARAKRLVATKFFALDLVTRMLAGREGELRDLVRQVDTESRFQEWVHHCCERIEAHADAERAAKFRDSVGQTLAAS